MVSTSSSNNFFGYFLASLKDPESNAMPRADGEKSTGQRYDFDRLLRQLASGPKALSELMKSGDSLTSLLDATEKLREIGFIERIDGDRFQLTTKGKDAASISAPQPH